MLFYNPRPRVNILPFNFNMSETLIFAAFDKVQKKTYKIFEFFFLKIWKILNFFFLVVEIKF